MGKKGKMWLIIATLLVLVGCITFGGVMSLLNWDFTKLSTNKYETNDYEVCEEYKNISIVTNTADIVFTPSETEKTLVVCYEQKNIRHSVKAQNGTLVIETIDTRKWYEYIGINFAAPKITVHIPKGEYGALSIKSSTGKIEIPKDYKFESIDILERTGDVKNAASAFGTIKIKTNTGNIYLEGLSANTFDLSVSTGRITVSNATSEGEIKANVSTGKTSLVDIRCQNVISKGSTGDILLKNVIATQKIMAERSTGDVGFEGSDAAQIYVKTDTGSVKGTLLSEKVFIAQTDTGSVTVPKTESGGRCEITTDTGNIRLEIAQ